MITHLVAPQSFEEEDVSVEGDAYRHLFRARRLAVGERVRVADGTGRARWAKVTRIDRRRAALALAGEAPANEPPYRLTLVVAALRGERASWLVEKATELGAAAIRFLASERTPRRYGQGNLERWRRVAASALVQCHRAALPEISGVHDWNELDDLLGAGTESWFLDPIGISGFEPGAEAGAVLVGPEGGWSEAERGELEARGIAAVTLGPRVLRVETAAVAATAQILLRAF